MPGFNYWAEEKEANILAGQNGEAKQTPLKLRALKSVPPSVKGQAKKEIYLLAKRAKKKMFVSSCRSGGGKKNVESFIKKP